MENSGIRADEAAALNPLQGCQQPRGYCLASVLQAPQEPDQIILLNSSRSQQEQMSSNSVSVCGPFQSGTPQ